MRPPLHLVSAIVWLLYTVTKPLLYFPIMLITVPWYGLSFVSMATLHVKGWRKEVYRQCSSRFGYYESSENIAYTGSDLHVKCWFKNEDNMRSFIEDVLDLHKTFCGSCPKLDLIYDWNPHYDIIGLKPFMSGDYNSSDSSSPDLTEVSFSDGGMSYASLATPAVYFMRVEDESAFGDIMATSCHIADKALYRDYDTWEDNRLYLTQDTHCRFDGRQTVDKLPHIGVFFVEFSGAEDVQYSGTTYKRDKVIIGFQIPFPYVKDAIKFKPGSFMRNGHMHTFVHVKSHLKFKCFLDLKYAKTTAQWTQRGIAFEAVANIDVEETINQLDALQSFDR